MKKVLTSILIILLMFNFICCNISFSKEANGKEDDKGLNGPAMPSNEIETNLLESGTDGSNSTKAESYGTSKVASIIGAFCRFIDFCVLQLDLIMSQVTVTSTYDDGGNLGTDFWFTVDRTVFNKIGLFNVNYFAYTEEGSSYNVGDKCTVTADPNNIEIKNSISSIYYICRVIALVVGLLVLIYIGIRMAISTVASDQAKYKKMLISWIESIIILFFMPYIISAIFAFGDAVTGIFYDIRCSLIGSQVPGTSGEYGVFEQKIRLNTLELVFSKAGYSLAMISIVYWCLLFTEVKFLWLYSKRLLMVGFLIIISPLITITYSIDKAGDGRAQAFSTWIKEFLLNVLIQPLHALLYLIFVFSANAIASQSTIVAVALLFAMGQAERMVKVIFNMKGSVSLRGIDKFLKKEG